MCVCRWADGDEAMYTNWSQSSLPSTANDNNRDCVTFAADGWMLHDDCAITDFPFVCKMRRKLHILSTGFKYLYTLSTQNCFSPHAASQSRDGNVWIGSEPSMMAAQGPDVGLVVGVVFLLLFFL